MSITSRTNGTGILSAIAWRAIGLVVAGGFVAMVGAGISASQPGVLFQNSGGPASTDGIIWD
ncbi:hypothetical protein [Microbispora bryophytorum]|uniref:Uncharacterized protein n=1 Tax=Microbispora bryophytorum subsp. camponoti TaxID=1677852 RepID=A0ABR8L8L1_9ACTN|nr:hypothetical protein [Microbispora camponoti]MBD3146576.1 hypothetical protein [Microbispora camponoti]